VRKEDLRDGNFDQSFNSTSAAALKDTRSKPFSTGSDVRGPDADEDLGEHGEKVGRTAAISEAQRQDEGAEPAEQAKEITGTSNESSNADACVGGNGHNERVDDRARNTIESGAVSTVSLFRPTCPREKLARCRRRPQIAIFSIWSLDGYEPWRWFKRGVPHSSEGH
jgi:hypothetical protein